MSPLRLPLCIRPRFVSFARPYCVRAVRLCLRFWRTPATGGAPPADRVVGQPVATLPRRATQSQVALPGSWVASCAFAPLTDPAPVFVLDRLPHVHAVPVLADAEDRENK